MASKSWRDTRILICGGGPAGLVTALTLEMCGFANFEILEKRTKDKYYRDVGGGYDLSPSTASIMERFGVTAEFEDATYQLPIMELCELNGKCFRQLAVPQEMGIRTTRRSNLQKVLVNKLGENRIRFGCGVQSVSEAVEEDVGEKMCVTTSAGQKLECDIVIGAEGLHSRTRAYVAGESQCHPVDQGCLAYWGTIEPEKMRQLMEVGEIQMGELPEGQEGVARWGFGAGLGVAFYLLESGENVWVLMKQEGEEARKVRKEKETEEKKEEKDWRVRAKDEAVEVCKLTAISGVREAVKHTPAERIARTPIQDLDPIKVWHRNGAVLTGDSAHAVTPFIGQGANMAVTDGYVLGKLLATHLAAGYREGKGVWDAVERASQEYEAMRVESTNYNVLESRTWGSWMVTDSWLKAWLVNTLSWITPGFYLVNQFSVYDEPNRTAITEAEEKWHKEVESRVAT